MRQLIAILLIIWCCDAQAQISVTSGFHKDSIQLGESVDYTIAAKVSDGVMIDRVELIYLDSIISEVKTRIHTMNDSLGRIEPQVADYNVNSLGRWVDENDDNIISHSELSWDTTKVDNTLLLENTINISFWDAGPITVKTVDLYYTVGGQTSAYKSNNGAQILVAAPFDASELQDSVDIAPIKNIIKEDRNITDFYPLFYVLGIILFLGAAIYFFRRYRGQEIQVKEEEEVIIPSHELALSKLDTLRGKQLWQQGKIKDYQSELTYIIREYLENRYGIQALESSTDEIISDLRANQFDKEDEADLKNILQVADLVKFAKAKPSEEIHEQFLNTAVTFVNRTKEIITLDLDIEE